MTKATLAPIRCSIVVSISACHAEDPGSIPGGGDCLGASCSLWCVETQQQCVEQDQLHESDTYVVGCLRELSGVRAAGADVFNQILIVVICKGLWRNGSASDSRSEGWEFESLCPHVVLPQCHFTLLAQLMLTHMSSYFAPASSMQSNTNLMIKMDTLGIEPRTSRMLSGCDTTTPCAQ